MSRTFYPVLTKRRQHSWNHIENLAAQRTRLLTSLLPNALAFGSTDRGPNREPLKVASHYPDKDIILMSHQHSGF